MSPIRVGVIGLSTQGWAATGLIPPLLEPLLKDKYTITAIATRSAASAKATAAKYSELTGNTVKGYYGEGGATQIANDPDVDLVVVSVKVTDHWKAAKPAIDASKDIFLEWSPGKSLEENIALAEAAKAKGVRSIIGVQSGQSVTIRNVDQLIKAGKVGRILSVSASLVMPSVTGMGAKTAIEQVEFALDADNGTTLLTMLVGHFLTDLIHLVGQFKEVSATTTILFPDVEIVDTAGKPVGRTVRKTAPDQLVLTGTLGGANDGAIVTIHAQSGPATARHLWFIDGEEGTIEVRNKPENGPFGVFLTAHEMKLSWNDVEVEAPPQTDEDGLGNVTKAWLEFAKGKDGKYATLDDAVAVWRVIDAALKSIAAGGKKIPIV